MFENSINVSAVKTGAVKTFTKFRGKKVCLSLFCNKVTDCRPEKKR